MWWFTLAIAVILGGEKTQKDSKPILTQKNATCTTGTCGRRTQCSNDHATGGEKTERATPDVVARRSGRHSRGGLVARLRVRNESRGRRCAGHSPEQRPCRLDDGSEEQPPRGDEAVPNLGSPRRQSRGARSSSRGRYSEKSTHTTLLFNRGMGGGRFTRQPVLVGHRVHSQELAMG